MCRISLLIYLFFFNLLIPNYLLAQNEETNFSADTITIEPGGSLKAVGNVVIGNGNIYINADAIEINENTKLIKFSGINKFSDGQNINLSAKNAILDSELSNGIILAANILIDQTIDIQADEVRLKYGDIESANSINRITSCEECDDGKRNWYFTASSAKRDFENLNIVYKDVVLRVKNTPIAYLPYLRLPDPSVDRARGFLVPEAIISSNLGTGIKLPYFMPIGAHRDILVSPFVSPKTKTVEFRYREKLNNGNLSITGALSSDEISNGDPRYFYKAEGAFNLSYGVKLGLNFGQVSDNSYLGDYFYSLENEIESNVSMDKTEVDRNRFFEGGLKYVRDKDVGTALSEYYSVDLNYMKSIPQSFLPGKIYLNTGINSSLNINADDSLSRPPSSAQVGLNFSNKYIVGSSKITNEAYTMLNSFVNAENIDSSSEDLILQYGVSSRVEFPFSKISRNKITTISPWLALSFNQQEGTTSGEFFKGSDELSFGNIKMVKKYSSLSESEEKISLSFGLDYDLFVNYNRRLSFSLGGYKLGGASYSVNTNNGLVPEKLAYVGSFQFNNESYKILEGAALVSDNGDLLSGKIANSLEFRDFVLETGYEYLSPETDKRLSRSLENLFFSGSYSFWEEIKLSSDGRFNLTEDKMASNTIGVEALFRSWKYKLSRKYLKTDPDRLSLSALYEDDCTILKIAYEKRDQEIGLSDPVQTITLSVQFKPFGNFILSKGLDDVN